MYVARANAITLDNNVDQKEARERNRILIRGDEPLFTANALSVASFHSGSLIVDRYDILIAYYFPFLLLARGQIPRRGIEHDSQPNISRDIIDPAFLETRFPRRDLRNTLDYSFNCSP